MEIREKEIAALLCRGARAAAIAARLGISVNTAYKHIANMYQKMHVNNRQELIYMMTEKTDPSSRRNDKRSD